MIIYQLFVIFVIVSAAANVYGIEDNECNLNEQLDEHYLNAAYLDLEGALYFNGEKMGEILKPEYMGAIHAVDAIRIDVKKFVLLGYIERGVTSEDKDELKKILVVGYDDNNEIKEYYNQTFSDGVRINKLHKYKAYYEKDENVIYFDPRNKIYIENGTYAIGDAYERCFEEFVQCVYDPYTQKLKVDDAHNTRQYLFSTSCNLDVFYDRAKFLVSDGKEDGSKFCLGTDEKYQKIFLFPDFTKYSENECDKTAIISKPKPTTTATSTVSPTLPITTTTSTVPSTVPPTVTTSTVSPTVIPPIEEEVTTPDVKIIITPATESSNNVYDAGSGSKYEECSKGEKTMWYGAAAAFIIALLIFIAGLAMIAIARKGAAKKKEYLLNKKNDPFAYTTKAEAQLMAQAQAQEDIYDNGGVDGGAGAGAETRIQIEPSSKKSVKKLNDSSKNGNLKKNKSISKR